MILVTNNKDAVKRWEERKEIEVVLVDSHDILEVLYRVRDLLHKGHWLMTHPYTGGLKPNENPFKSVLVSSSTEDLNMDQVMTLEQCLSVSRTSLENRPVPHYSEKLLADYRLVDLDLISNGILRAFESGKVTYARINNTEVAK